MTATSGQRLCECLGKSNPLGLLVRTLLGSSRWWSSARLLQWKCKPLFSRRVTAFFVNTEKLNSTRLKEFAPKLRRRDIPSNRLLYQLVPLARPTDATECGLSRDGRTAQEALGRYCKVELLPTPLTNEIRHPEAQWDKNGRRIAKSGRGFSPSLSDKVSQLLPTPTTFDSQRPLHPEYGVREDGTVYNPAPTAKKSGLTLSEKAQLGLLPTPQALDFKRTTRKEESHFVNLTDIAYKEKSLTPIGGPSQLNPLFWEEIMGYPLLWTISPFLTENSEPRR